MDSPGYSTCADHNRSSAVWRVVQKCGHVAALQEVFGRRRGFSILPTWNFFRGWLATRSRFGQFVILAVLVIGMGALRMVRANAVCASILAVLLLPGLLLVLLATARGIYLQEWYLSSMLPGVVAVAAVGIVTVLSGLQRVRGMRWAPLPLALLFIAGYAAFTGRIRHRLMSRSMEPFRESVEMTRPTLNPNAPENQRIITASSLMFPLIYDPLVRKALTVEEYKTLMHEADARKVPLYVNNGFIAGVKDRYPEIHDFLVNEQYFECVATLHGTEPMFDRTVYRYRSGSLNNPD